MREIRSTDLASYHILLHKKIEEIASFPRRIGGDSSVINFVQHPSENGCCTKFCP